MHRDTQNILLWYPKNYEKNLFFFLVYIKMDQENMFFKNQDESYTMIYLYLHDRFFGHKDSYNYYDIDVDKILF